MVLLGIKPTSHRLDLSVDGGFTERILETHIEVDGVSPMLYLFYNEDLIEQCNDATDAMSTGYIDDVAILA